MLESAVGAAVRARRPAFRLARQASGRRGSRRSGCAGEAAVPFTTGLLIGIGETRAERIEALLALRDLHARYGHIQEIIVQNFRAKPGTRMASAPAPCARRASVDDRGRAAPLRAGDEHPGAAESEPRRASAADRRRHQRLGRRLAGDARPRQSGSAVAAARGAARARPQRPGKELVERLAIYPAYARRPERWVDPALRKRRAPTASTRDGLPRDRRLVARDATTPPAAARPRARSGPALGARELDAILAEAQRGEALGEAEIVALFRGARRRVRRRLRAPPTSCAQRCNGDTVTYVVNRNINYTNICSFRCQFCAFSKGKTEREPARPALRPAARRDRGAGRAKRWERGATEVCMQGGIHPAYTGATYLEICRAVKAAVPEMHVHAFSPLEV